jgi:hypothetical protein
VLLDDTGGRSGACQGRQGPATDADHCRLFREGRLSYSKVREVTRVVDVVDETRLAELALTATASQLARMLAGFRCADGMRIGQQAKRNLSWHEREDGMIDFRARLPKEEAALLLAAIEAAKDQFGPPPAKPDPCGEESDGSSDAARYSNADALVDVARVFLDTAPEDRSGADRSLARHLDFARRRRQQLDQLAAVDSFQHPNAQTIRPRWTGEPFDVHACVEALFTIKLPKHPLDLDQQAA